MDSLPFHRCTVCGSVFFHHRCHALPDWIALMIARTDARRAVRNG